MQRASIELEACAQKTETRKLPALAFRWHCARTTKTQAKSEGPARRRTDEREDGKHEEREDRRLRTA